MEQHGVRDVFISYSSRDREHVRPVVEALTERGLTLWFDQEQLRPFDSALTTRIDEGVTRSRLTIAFASDAYLESDPCKYELLATLREGGLDRLLVVALPGLSRPLGVMAENVHQRLAGDPESDGGLPDVVSERLADLPETAPAHPDEAAVWWEEEWSGATFEGRFDERLRLLSTLEPHLGRRSAHAQRFDRAQIVGIGGQGKSMLALQHARDFQRDFRSIARFDAGGDRHDGYVQDEAGFLDDILGQILAWVTDTARRRSLQLTIPGRQDADAWPVALQVAAELVAALDGRVLWIVDDVPGGLSDRAVQRLLCPGGGKTIITTRPHDYDAYFDDATIALSGMDPDESAYLLARGDAALLSGQRDILHEIAREVDGHALALAVLAPRIAAWSAHDVLGRLKGQPAAAVAELERAAQRIGSLPGGHGASIVATLSMSIGALAEPTAWDTLRLASAWPTSMPMPLLMLSEVLGDDAIEGVQELVMANLAEKSPDESLKVHALVCGVAEQLAAAAPGTGLQSDTDLRRAAAEWLRPSCNDKADVWHAAEAGETAWHLLEPIESGLGPELRRVAAEALMAIARLPMQHKPPDVSGPALVDHLQRPLALARQAEQLRTGPDREDRLGVGRAQAMQGLLMLDQAHAEPDAARQVQRAGEGRAMLERSVDTRLPLLEGSQAAEDVDELIRSYFNFGRLLIAAKALAKASPSSEVAATLDSAAAAYSRARDARQASLDRGPAEPVEPATFENLASCHRGLATVCFIRAMYQPGLSAEERQDLIEQAHPHVTRARENTHVALQMRRRANETPAGVSTPDMAKDLQMLAKLRLGEWALNAVLTGADPDLHDLDELQAALDPDHAVALAGDLVPWDAHDPSDLGSGHAPASLDLARLRVHQARGGRGATAAATLADFRDNDLPALLHALEEA